MSPPDGRAWRPWSPEEVAARLDPLGVTWCVAGGWAIDLAAGRRTRDHGDMEVAVLRRDYHVVRDALRELSPHAAVSGTLHALAPGEEPPEGYFQTWFTDGEAWLVDVMIEPGDDDTWVYRRDETVRAPRSFMVARTADGVPYLAPHGGLLFKAKYGRAKDEADFAVVEPLLPPEQRAWLVDVLRRLHPEHRWLSVLTASP